MMPTSSSSTRRSEPSIPLGYNVRQPETVSVPASIEPKREETSKPSSPSTPPATFGSDDLDIPTFLRNRR
jgi:hypothetical protein